jgi:hypothetical protein
MSEQGPPSGPGKPLGQDEPRKLNGHVNGHANGAANGGAAKPESAGKAGPSVVVPFPKKKAARPTWLTGLLAWRPGRAFGAVMGWLAVLGFAGMFWGVSKDGAVDAIDVLAGLFGVLTALWFHRSR